MNEQELTEIFRKSDELTRLSGIIEKQKPVILERFPEVLCMTSCPIEDSKADCKISIEISEKTEGLQEALQSYFRDEPITLHITETEPEKQSLVRTLFKTDISDVLDTTHYRDGLYMSIKLDKDGAYIDMRLTNDTENIRHVIQEAYPDARFKFDKNDKPLTFRVAPSF